MPDYTFHTLSPIDFENLSRDLIQSEHSIRLETFKTGKDDGIDFRYAQAEGISLVVQAKHFLKTGFRGLLSHLKSKEKEKIEKLQPDRYILTTSVPLSPANKKKIIEELSPFLKNPGDIYGKDDLNNLLGLFPSVEKKHSKLWLSSINILEEVLHSRIINQSATTLQNIRDKSCLYVANRSFNKALDILKEHNYVVIAGIPGIGKTTLANMLVLHYLKKDYEFIDVTDDISDAYTVHVHHRPRIVLYDDFLGRTSLSEKLRTKEDQRLVKFISGIRKSKTSKLILTTREYILTKAQETYELLNEPIFEKPQCIVDLSQYTRPIRAQILYNHLYFSNLPTEYIEEMVKQIAYLEIIDHLNYNPRIIEYMTDPMSVDCAEASQYPATFLRILKKPFLIWELAFCDHLTQIARDILLVLVSLPREVFVEDLELATKNFTSSRKEKNAEKIFRRALAELQGNFIVLTQDRENDIVSFHSPSVRDFMENYLEKNKTLYGSLGKSVYFFEQIQWLSEKGVHKTIEKPIKELLSLRKDFAPRSCGLISFESSSGNSMYKRRRTLTHIDAVTFVASLLKKSGFASLEDDFRNALKKLTTQMLDIHPGSFELWHLIREVVALDHTLDLKNELLVAAKEAFYQDAEWISDLSYLAYSFELCPEMFSPEDGTRVQESIEEIIDNSLEYNDDPQLITEELDCLKEIEEKTGIQLTEQTERVTNLLLSAEENSPQEEDYDHDDDGYQGSSDGESISNDGLSDMFSTLLE